MGVCTRGLGFGGVLGWFCGFCVVTWCFVFVVLGLGVDLGWLARVRGGFCGVAGVNSAGVGVVWCLGFSLVGGVLVLLYCDCICL